MRTVERTQDGAPPLRDILAVGLAILVVGVSFGAVAIGAGLPGWAVIAMSVLIFAGGAQFTAVGLVAAGSPVAAILAGLLLNARHLPFGLALADTLGGRWGSRLLGSHLLTDEATAFVLATPDGPARRRTFWRAGGLFFLAWNAGTLLGLLLGTAAGDPARFGLDAAFPAGLLALLLPALRDRRTRQVALLGAGIAVLTTIVLPAGLPVLLSLTALVVLLPATRRRRPRSGAEPEPGPEPGPGAELEAGPEPGPEPGPGAKPEAGPGAVAGPVGRRKC